MIISIKKYKWLLAILLIALAVRLIYFVNIRAWENSYIENMLNYNDGNDYQSIVLKIVETGCYPENIYLDTFRTPAFPIYLAIIYFLFGIKPFILFLSYIILNLISIVFIYRLCIKLFDNAAIALIASALFALEPNIIRLSMEFGTETLHMTLLITSVYYFIAGLKDKKYILICVSSILFALTALTRPVSLYFYILCLLLVLLYPGENIKSKLKFASLFIIVYFLSISPWMYRNYRTYGYFSTNTFQNSVILYDAIYVKIKVTGASFEKIQEETLNDVEKICREKNITNQFENANQKGIYGFNYLMQHIDTYSILHLKGMVKFFISPLNNPKYSLKNKIVIGLYFLFIYLFAALGAYRMFKDKQYVFLYSFLIAIIYFWVLTGMFGVSRYRIPTTPFYLIISSYGIYYYLNKWKYKLIKKRT